MFLTSIKGSYRISPVDADEARVRMKRLAARLGPIDEATIEREGHLVRTSSSLNGLDLGLMVLLIVPGRVELDAEQGVVRYEASIKWFLVWAMLGLASMAITALAIPEARAACARTFPAGLWAVGAIYALARWRFLRALRDTLGPAPTRF